MPRVVFGATVLGNLFVAMTDKQKHALVGEWMAQMPKPVAIDSAGKYGAGLSLEVIARELAAYGIAPDDVIISNKLAWRRVPLTADEPTFEPGVWIDINHDAVQDISYEGILRCYDDGNATLSPYASQLVALHDPDEYLAAATDEDDRIKRLDDLKGAHRALVELRDAGKIAGVGIGAKDWRVIGELDQECAFDWVMMANSFTVMNHPTELVALIDSLASRNVGIINSAVTHGGFITGGKFLDYREVDESSQRDAEVISWRERFTNVCRAHGYSPYLVSVVFGISHPGIASLALSTSNPARVASMIEAATTELPASFWNELKDEGLVDRHYAHVGED